MKVDSLRPPSRSARPRARRAHLTETSTEREGAGCFAPVTFAKGR